MPVGGDGAVPVEEPARAALWMIGGRSLVHVIRSGCPGRNVRETTVCQRLSTTASTDGRAGLLARHAVGSCRSWSGYRERPFGLDLSRRIAVPTAVKGREGTGHRRLARPADHQSPRNHRCNWPAGGDPPHCRQRQRRNRCAASDRRDPDACAGLSPIVVTMQRAPRRSSGPAHTHGVRPHPL